MGFNEKLAAAKEKGRPSRVVTVCLDADISARLAVLEDERDDALHAERQDGRLAKKSRATELNKQIEAVRAEFADALVDLKFTRLIGSAWLELIAHNPPRPDNVADNGVFGYNFHAVTREAAEVSGVVVEGDEDRELSESEWDDLFGIISGGDHQRVADVIYALNEAESLRAVELGKALRAAARDSEKKSD